MENVFGEVPQGVAHYKGGPVPTGAVLGRGETREEFDISGSERVRGEISGGKWVIYPVFWSAGFTWSLFGIPHPE